jgi:hypothetical protein
MKACYKTIFGRGLGSLSIVITPGITGNTQTTRKKALAPNLPINIVIREHLSTDLSMEMGY